MAIVKINLNEIHYPESAISNIRAVQNQILMYESFPRLLIFTDLSIKEFEETYGRRKNKTKKVRELYCRLIGWNYKGDFVGDYGSEEIKKVLNHFDILSMRKTFLEFQKQYNAMLEYHENLTTPDFLKNLE